MGAIIEYSSADQNAPEERENWDKCRRIRIKTG